jgi:hypothetical protein
MLLLPHIVDRANEVFLRSALPFLVQFMQGSRSTADDLDQKLTEFADKFSPAGGKKDSTWNKDAWELISLLLLFMCGKIDEQGQSKLLRRPDMHNSDLAKLVFTAKVRALIDAPALCSQNNACQGWLAHDIYFHVLSRRFRVDYGLLALNNEPRVKLVAVPYRAKDTPSLRSEFAHPETLIGFTLLTYLYEGLNQAQFGEIWQLLADRSKEAPQAGLDTRNAIVSDSKAFVESQGGWPAWWPDRLEELDVGNSAIVEKAAQLLGRNVTLIFAYLHKVVFPRACTVFPKKLTGNANSLVSEGCLLGFSGTDDKKVSDDARCFDSSHIFYRYTHSGRRRRM